MVETFCQDRVWVQSHDSEIGEATWRPSVEKGDLIHWQSALRSQLQAWYAALQCRPNLLVLIKISSSQVGVTLSAGRK